MNSVPTQTHAHPEERELILCADCNIRFWDVWGCINNYDYNKICLMCCGCPEHEDYWGEKCCGESYHNPDCYCCLNECATCSESVD